MYRDSLRVKTNQCMNCFNPQDKSNSTKIAILLNLPPPINAVIEAVVFKTELLINLTPTELINVGQC